jgi:hypothetical protein
MIIIFKEVGKLARFATNGNDELNDFKINFDKTKARFLKVVATNLKESYWWRNLVICRRNSGKLKFVSNSSSG